MIFMLKLTRDQVAILQICDKKGYTSSYDSELERFGLVRKFQIERDNFPGIFIDRWRITDRGKQFLDQKNKIVLCPFCGQPINTKDLGSKYFPKKEDDK